MEIKVKVRTVKVEEKVITVTFPIYTIYRSDSSDSDFCIAHMVTSPDRMVTLQRGAGGAFQMKVESPGELGAYVEPNFEEVGRISNEKEWLELLAEAKRELLKAELLTVSDIESYDLENRAQKAERERNEHRTFFRA